MSKNKQLSAENFKQIADKVNDETSRNSITYILNTCKDRAYAGYYSATFFKKEYFTQPILDDLKSRKFGVTIIDNQQDEYSATVYWS